MGAFDFFFLGGDTAPSDSARSDEGALIAACARPRVLPTMGKGQKLEDLQLSDNEADWIFGFCFGRSFSHKEKLSARQWSGIIHSWHHRFHFQKICLDGGAGGGGVYVKRELMEKEQIINGTKTQCVPICDQVDGPKRVVHGEFILHMMKRGDPGVEMVWPNPEDSAKSQAGDELLKDSYYSAFKEGLDGGIIVGPPTMDDLNADPEWREKIKFWPEERLWALKVLGAGLTVQLLKIGQAKREDGTQLFTKRGAKVFVSVGRDDIALAMMYCYAAFRIWLKAGLWQGQAQDDEVGFSGAQRS